MNRFHRMILVGFLMSFVLVNFETRARAQALEVVFKDSLWGAAIGSVVGLASWSLQDTDKDDTPKCPALAACIYGHIHAYVRGYPPTHTHCRRRS